MQEERIFFMAHNKIVEWFLFACGHAASSVFSSRAALLKLEWVRDPPADCAASEGEEESRHILPLDVVFRRYLRSVYINSNDNKTST